MRTVIGSTTVTGSGWAVTGNVLRVDHLRPCVADTSSDANTYRANAPADYECKQFLQIPTASPPVGALRFEDAVYVPLSGSYDATVARTVPFQNFASEYGTNGRPQDGIDNGNWNWNAHGVIESEDCLNVNVYAPNYATTDAPTIFFIHGGGGDVNSNLSYYLQCDGLASKGAVVVMPSYRLGALGAKDDNGYNITDILAAWEWTLDHIEDFGGNPDKIIVAGVSFGGDATLAMCEELTGTPEFAGAWVYSGGGARRLGVEGFEGYSSRSLTERINRSMMCEAPFTRDISGNFDTAQDAIDAQGLEWALKYAFPANMFNKAHDGSNIWMRTGPDRADTPWEGIKTVTEPVVFQSVENEANLLGVTKTTDDPNFSQFRLNNMCNRFGYDRINARAWWAARSDAQFDRLSYNFGVFNYPAYRLAKNSGGNSWLVLWNYKSVGNGGDYAGHTSDACYATGNCDWQVGMVGDEAQVYYDDLLMQEIMMDKLINFAENLDPDTAHSGADRGLFASIPSLSFPQLAGEDWTVIGSTVSNAITSPVQATQIQFFGGFPAICYNRTDP